MSNRKVTIGEYLFKRLCELGCQKIIGVPGDFNLPLLEELKKVEHLDFIGTCNELNAAYAADGYGRIQGIAALITTYGVGELSALNGVAGAYAEHIPLICITGVPPLSILRSKRVIHHNLGDGDYKNMLHVHRDFTVAQTVLSPSNARIEIDRALSKAWLEKRPVYIQIPADIIHHTLTLTSSPLELMLEASHTGFLNDALAVITDRLNNAKGPAFLLDRDVMRYGLTPIVDEITATNNIPYSTLVAAKCALSEQSTLWIGKYQGMATEQPTKGYIEESDCLIAIAPLFDDNNSAHYTDNLPHNTIYLFPTYIKIEDQYYENINIGEFLLELKKRLTPRTKLTQPLIPYQTQDYKVSQNTPLTHRYLWQRLRSFFKKDDVILMDNGASSSALERIRMPDSVTYLAQPLWASIGFALPALLGALLANHNRRHILFIGDGALQMTVQELSTIMRHDFKPIIFIINNHGYTIERFFLGKHATYNDVANWDYTRLPQLFSRNTEQATTYIVHDEETLESALINAEKDHQLTLIELQLDPLDAPENFEELGYKVAEFNYGPYGPRP